MRGDITPFSKEKALGYLYSLANMAWPDDGGFVLDETGHNSYNIVNEDAGVVLQIRKRFATNVLPSYDFDVQELFPWPNFPTPRVLIPIVTLRYMGRHEDDKVTNDDIETVIYVSPYVHPTTEHDDAFEVYKKLVAKSLSADIGVNSEYAQVDSRNIGITYDGTPLIFDIHAPRLELHNGIGSLQKLLAPNPENYKRFIAQFRLWNEICAPEIVRQVLESVPKDFPFQPISTINTNLMRYSLSAQPPQL